MSYFKFIIPLVVVLIGSGFCFVKLINWNVKSGYTIKAGGGSDGEGISFTGLKAFIAFDEEDPGKSKIMATIDANTLSTGSKEMTAHAKEAIDVKNFPEITFKSTVITKTSAGYEATGDLTLKGVTKQIKFPFVFDSKKDISDKFPFVAKETFSGRIFILSKDFKITRMGTPEQIMITLSIPVTK